MGNWVILTELGERRCTAIKIKWDSTIGFEDSGNYNFTREYGVQGSEWGTWGSGFRFDLTAKNVCDANIKGGDDTFYRDFNAETYQGEYNGKKYYITYDGEYVQWEWTEPVYYYSFDHNTGGYDPEPIAADFIYVMLEGAEEPEKPDVPPTPEEPEKPITIADNLQRIIQAKSDIKTAIENKGVTVGNITIDGYAEKINQITDGELVKLPPSITFSGCTAIGDLDMSKWDWSDILIWERMFYMCKDITSITNIPHIKPPYMNSMFNVCKGLTTIDVSNIDTSKTKELIGVFSECTNLTEINGLENWDTSNVTNLSGLFSQTKVTKIEGVENWDTSNVTSLSNLVKDCSNLESVDFIKNWDLSKVDSMNGAFMYCDSLTELDLRGVNTESLTSMFQFCTGSENIEKIDLRGCDLSKVTTMHSAFGSGKNLKEIYMDSSLDSLKTVDSIFYAGYSYGTFYYNSNYDYSKILAKLPSTWTAVPL